MLQKKEYTAAKIPVTPTKPNVTKEGITTTPTKIPVTPTKPNVTKEGITTTTTIKKPIVENQTSGKIKTNVTKQGYQQQQVTNNNNNNKETNCRKSNFW